MLGQFQQNVRESNSDACAAKIAAEHSDHQGQQSSLIVGADQRSWNLYLWKCVDCSARWNAAAQVYRTSRAVSPTLEEKEKFGFDGKLYINQIISPKMSTAKTPISLEEIADMNRKRHEVEGGVISPGADIGPLELEAIAAVHELAHEVEDISVSEMLPRTSDLIFVNVKTQEGG
uniref:DUF727 domain-containing protein n=1 Tax=Caenorhabditis japonica TaxID=281687 RepID=A0A8R1HI15_CAEJA